MLKKFFISMLGTISGIWISFGLFFVFFMVFAIVAGISESGKKVEVKNHSILLLDLSGEITERPGQPQLFAELAGESGGNLALNQVVSAVRTAADDDKIDGIYIKANGSLAGFATRLDIRQAIEKFRETGKWVIAYADNYGQGDYFISSLADSLYVNPVGGIDIHGIASTTYMYKGLLDKLGVEMQIVKVGTYKSAVEPFILTEISPANAEQQKQFLSAIWNDVTDEISKSRDVSVADVNLWADSLIATCDPKSYAEKKIATGVAYPHQVRDIMKSLTDVSEDDDLRFITPAEYCESKPMLYAKEQDTKIAVLLAEGDIVDAGKKGIVGPRVVAEIEKITKDEDIDGLILRVNSGGGSAFASEQIWEALERYKETGRPLYVSMGDYAASGGYYISCGADKIYAQPVTLTGSIGIFGMIPQVGKLLNDKLGVTESTVKTNPSATFISLTKPMTPVERNALQRSINRGYETFVGRVAQGRGISVDSVKAIAEGRVWAGVDALKIGLVDELGNLNDVILDLAAELDAGDFCVIEYPNNKFSFREMLEDLDYTSFAEIVAKKTMTPAEYQAMERSRRIMGWNKVQARMPEVGIE